jgi:Conserved TM helix
LISSMAVLDSCHGYRQHPQTDFGKDKFMIDKVWQPLSTLGSENLGSVLVMQAAAATTSVDRLVTQVTTSVPNILGAIALLVVGWLVALILAWVVGRLLAKTSIDDRIMQTVTGGNSLGGWSPEKIVSTIVFWVIFLFGVIGFLNSLGLNSASAPLQNMLSQILTFLPRLLIAAALGIIAWVIATVVKKLILKSSQSFGLDQKMQSAGSTGGVMPSETIGNLSFWLILFFFLSPILEALSLGSSLAPVQSLTTELIGALPKLFKAAIIGIVTWFVAKLVRDIITNVARAAGSERLGAQLGLTRTMPNQSLAGIAGTLAYVVILVPGVIQALQALDMPAISGPAVTMLNEVTLMLPRVLTAGAIIAISYFIGRFLAELVTSTLSALGFDNILRTLGLGSIVDQAAPSSTSENAKTPSELAGIVVLVGTMLLAVVSALDILKIKALTNITESVIMIAGQILMGLVIFGVGLFLANLAYRLINAAGNRQANILAQAARICIIVLVGAMGLQRMGIASDIVNLAFGLTLGAISIAAAIAFGLGGRDVAGEQLREWLSGFRR